MQSPETQSLNNERTFRNLLYEEEGLRLWLYNVCGEWSFHVENDIEIDAKRLAHLRDVFACLLFTLGEKGMNKLDTWIPHSDKTAIRFAESFGFQPTGFDKIIQYENGLLTELMELRITF